VTASQVRLAAVAIVVLPLVGYPLVVLADGARFPSVEDCVHVATPDASGDLDLVFGRRDTPQEAEELLERVRAVGYPDAELRGDGGCGRWVVFYDGITSYEQGVESRAEARRDGGLDAELEVEPPG
jgi:hypothetical protein